MERIKKLYQLHKEAVFRYFLRMTGSWEEAGELTQETFYQACLSLYRFRQQSSLKTWLFSIARNIYLKHLREEGRYKSQPWADNLPLREQITQDADPPAKELIQKEQRDKILEALSRLSENARTIIILKEYEQLSYEEIAGIFGQTVNWTRVNFFRAKRQLGLILRELEGDHR